MRWYYIFIYVSLIALINEVLKNYTKEDKNKTKKSKKPIDKK